jgi:hypothetical protein
LLATTSTGSWIVSRTECRYGALVTAGRIEGQQVPVPRDREQLIRLDPATGVGTASAVVVEGNDLVVPAASGEYGEDARIHLWNTPAADRLS